MWETAAWGLEKDILSQGRIRLFLTWRLLLYSRQEELEDRVFYLHGGTGFMAAYCCENDSNKSN